MVYRITANVSDGYVFNVLPMRQYADSRIAATRSPIAFSSAPSKSTVKRAVDLLLSPELTQGQPGLFHPIRQRLLVTDYYMHLADLASYLQTQARVGQTYRLKYSPQHRWFYFPRMRRDEALVFKVYDSEKDGRARFTPHTSFDDPGTPAGAPPRQSIEARAPAFF